MTSQVVQWLKNLPINTGDAGDVGLIPELERSPRVGNGDPFQYSGLGNPRQRNLAVYSPGGCKELDMT